jgi:hypothetical protein
VTIGLAFTHALGDVDMQLTDGGGAVLATSNSTTSAETITQPVTGGQTYYVRVYGFGGAINPFYNMTIDGPAPVPASEVYVRGSTWSANFKTYMEAQGLGDDVLGYRVDNTAGNDVVPWVNVDEVVLRYSSPPTGSGIPTPGTVTLDGIRSDYTVSSVTALDPQTFVLRLDRALGVLPNPPGGENGDRVTLSAPGGPGGAAFSRRINVLQGDVDKSGSVVAADFSDVKARFFRTTAAPGPAGPTQYNVFRDVDGSGGILANDFSLVKARFFDNLPPPATVASPDAASITAQVFGISPVLA